MSFVIDDNYYCPSCGGTDAAEKACCGATMIERSETEGFGLSEFEPNGGQAYDYVDEWN